MRNFDYSALKHRSFDAEIVRLVGKIREYKGKQDLYMESGTAGLSTLEEVAKRQSADYSSRIEGIRTSDARFKKLMEGKVTPRNRDEQEIVGYRRVLETIHQNYDAIPLNPNIILQFHRDLLAGTGKGYAGKFKRGQNSIVEIDEEGNENVLFVPLSAYETPFAIERICSSFSKALKEEEVDPLLLIPCFILDFLSIHPFEDGNGRMSRLLTLLLLYQSGFLVGKYISIEKEIADSKNLYYDSLSASDQGWHEGKNDPAPFIRYMLAIILSSYVGLDRRLSSSKEVGKKASQYEVVKDYVNGKMGKITTSLLLSECPHIGKSSAVNALNQLIKEGVLEKRGKGKNTYYVKLS